ncbi:MAG: hypothetical protein OIF47_05840 [Marinibacterium sp.]|nr:hypothetical protein [Marinibacterium sp.]
MNRTITLVSELSNILRNAILVLGVGVAAVLYFLHLENTPMIDLHVDFVGVDHCAGLLDVALDNTGLMPFNPEQFRIELDMLDGRHFGPHDRIPDPGTLAAKENTSYAVQFPVTSDLGGQMAKLSFSVHLSEDGQSMWRVFDSWVRFPAVPDAC